MEKLLQFNFLHPFTGLALEFASFENCAYGKP